MCHGSLHGQLMLDTQMITRRQHLVTGAAAATYLFGMHPRAAGQTLPDLDPAKLMRVSFQASGRVTDEKFFASVTFQTREGFVKLSSAGRVWINAEPVIPSALKNTGFWYTARPRKSATYQVEFILGEGQPTIRRSIQARPFGLVLPALVSRSAPLMLNFTGVPLQPGETLHADISDEVEGRLLWKRVLAPTALGNVISIPTTPLTSVVLGQARLNVWVVNKATSATGDFETVYTVGEERMVWVTN